MRSSRWSSSVVGAGAIVLLAASSAVVVVVDAGCLKDSRLCCDGKNNTCRREGPRVTNNDSFTCFCDAVCNQLGDCCVDYRQACQAVDCVLSGLWSDWSSCSVSCGSGLRRRQRRVQEEALNGGRRCDPVVESMPCKTRPCPVPDPQKTRQVPDPQKTRQVPDGKSRDESSLEVDDDAIGMAKIIPVVVEESALHGDQNSSSSSSSSSSLEAVRHHHSQRNDNHDGNDDNRDEDNGDNDHFENVDVEERAQHRRDKTYFAIFEMTDVRPACHVTTTTWPHPLTKGAEVCVECRALAVRRRLGNQCKGHGMTSHETRWVTLTIPGCHGRWTLIRSHGDGSCRDAGRRLDFLFA